MIFGNGASYGKSTTHGKEPKKMTAIDTLVDSQFCSETQAEAFIDWLADTLGASTVEVRAIRQLSGGAIQQNWLIETQIDNHHPQKWVLRCDAPSALGISHQRAQEAELLIALAPYDIAVPKIYALSPDPSPIGKGFFVMEYIDGIAQAKKLTRHPDKASFSGSLVRQLGQQMARLHQITEDDMHISWLSRPQISAELSALDEVRTMLAKVGGIYPVLDYGLYWLELHLSEWHQGTDYRLCHRDFRTGNFLVHDGRMTALLDWEFAGWSVPAEDIGWLCARCWRFGDDMAEVGGLGNMSAFKEGYLSIADEMPSEPIIRFWQIFAELRWAAIALEQTDRCINGDISLELALSAPLVAEMEYNLLAMIAAPDIKASLTNIAPCHYQMPEHHLDAIIGAIDASITQLDRLESGSKKNYINAMITHGKAMIHRATSQPIKDDDSANLMQKIALLRQNQLPAHDPTILHQLMSYVHAKLAITNPSYHLGRPDSMKIPAS